MFPGRHQAFTHIALVSNISPSSCRVHGSFPKYEQIHTQFVYEIIPRIPVLYVSDGEHNSSWPAGALPSHKNKEVPAHTQAWDIATGIHV